MKSKFIAILLLLMTMVAGNVFSQSFSMDDQKFSAGRSQSIKLNSGSKIDSAQTSYSPVFDISFLDGQTAYYHVRATTASSAGADSARVILQGYMTFFGTTSPFLVNLDTIGVYAITSTTILSGTLTPTNFLPTVRLKIEPVGGTTAQPNRDWTAFDLVLYSRVEDYVPTAVDLGNVSP